MDIFAKCYGFTKVEEAKAAGYYFMFRRIESAQATEVIVDGRKLVMAGSNNYLGLTNHPKIKEAAIKAVQKYGSGCAGSRVLNGNLDIHEELEEKLAAFFRKEAAAVFATGYQTNLGTISALVGRNDVAILDKFDHASIIDGCRLSLGEARRFRHNDMEDLERVLQGASNKGGKLIIVDGVFSMEGDIAPLPEIVALAKNYGARVMVDDAHAVGVLGEGGTGTPEYFHMEDEVDMVMGTYSKTLAAIGGFIAAPKEVVSYIKHFGRSMIFSASLAPALVAAVSAALDVIIEEPELRERLWYNTHKMLKGFKELGFDTGNSETPIIPVIIGDQMRTFGMCRLLQEYGVFVNPVITPAVPPGRELLRTSFMATHTEEQLDKILDAFEQAGRKLGVI
ncbi:MAG: aminotransferase class I/II-fold pyridoxal phosphate-dependent enzyme [Deltaproteobacteria bacterium]|nr:MAG: aminotransferase class I/II-fold pyridoxal phosphate-dependent enzyme [Deltaproteobacteria bacterium]